MCLTEFILEYEGVSGVKDGPQKDEEVRWVLLDSGEEVGEGLIQQVVCCGERSTPNNHLHATCKIMAMF